MMNRPNPAEAYVPSMMSFKFVGPQGSRPQKPHLWDRETDAQNPNTNTHQNHPFFPNTTPFLDCPPPLLPMNSFPFHSPPLTEHPAGLIKGEEGGGRTGLNLGHQTCFPLGGALAIDRLLASSRGVYSLTHHHPPGCQVEGCKADLSGAKEYHRRHKVCDFHSKAAAVVVVAAAGGMQQRFCQQCSRFHVLSEFDEAKRSCRKRLADHNRRRRKPAHPPAEDSAPKNPTTTSTKTSRHTPKPTKDTSASKPTPTISPAARTSMKGQQGYRNKATLLRKGPALSDGGAGAEEEEGMGWSQYLYKQQQHLHHHRQQQIHLSSPSSSSDAFLQCHHHHSLQRSTSTEASQSTGRGSDHQQCSQAYLHLGQAMLN